MEEYSLFQEGKFSARLHQTSARQQAEVAVYCGGTGITEQGLRGGDEN